MKTNLLLQRATELKLHGMITHWDEICEAEWIEPLITWEETERAHRSLERRLTSSHIKRFKPLAQFDWNWPKRIPPIIPPIISRYDVLNAASIFLPNSICAIAKRSNSLTLIRSGNKVKGSISPRLNSCTFVKI